MFFLIVALVSANLSAEGIPVAVVLLLVLLPIFIGIVTGFVAGKLLQRTKTPGGTLAVMLAMLLVSAASALPSTARCPRLWSTSCSSACPSPRSLPTWCPRRSSTA